MSTSHKFTVKTSACDEVYIKDRSRNLCSIHNACYPFAEVGTTTELFPLTPLHLARFLLEDNIPFSYEPNGIEEANEQLLQASHDVLRAEHKDLRQRYQTLNDMFEELVRKFSELQAKHREHDTKDQNLSNHVAGLEYRLAQIRGLT